jgi:hypothetical protein
VYFEIYIYNSIPSTDSKRVFIIQKKIIRRMAGVTRVSCKSSINSLNYDIKVFKPALKDYLLSHNYSVEEFTSIENY